MAPRKDGVQYAGERRAFYVAPAATTHGASDRNRPGAGRNGAAVRREGSARIGKRTLPALDISDIAKPRAAKTYVD